MTESLSNLPGGSESSLRDAAEEVSEKSETFKQLTNDLIDEKPQSNNDITVDFKFAGSDHSSDNDLTVISPPPSFGSQKETVASLEGKRVGHFELKQFLGGGGMGLVFRAYDAVLDRSVAIKLLPREGTSAQTLRRFQVEARSAARLDHPNISRIFQVGSETACDYIVFEYVEGDNLAQLVRRIGPLPLELGLRYTFQLALALQHAYQRGVVHRDVKPANVVVTDGGKLKLIDLGLARSPKANESDESLTAAGVTLGTYDYISPEQARDSRTADVRSDLYSLGCTIFFMFTGRPPYPEGTPIEKIIQHSSEKRPNPNDYRSDLPTGFNKITNKLLAIDPKDRFQRPAELIAEIQELASSNSIPLLGYDDNVIVKRIVQKPSWLMQLIPVLIPIALLIGFVFSLDLFSGSSTTRNDDIKDNDLIGANESEQKGGTNKALPENNQNTAKEKSPTDNSNSKSSKTVNSNSKQPTKNTARTTSRVVYVGQAPPNAPEARSVKSLASAVEFINVNPTFDTILINQDRILVSEPVSLKVETSVNLRAAPGKSPLIVFRHSGDESYAFRIEGGKISFSNLHFRDEFSDRLSGIATTANFFQLVNVESAAFNECSLTVVNNDVDGNRFIQNANVLQLTDTRREETEISSLADLIPKPTISFHNCVVRGGANLLGLRKSVPLTLRFENGIFVSDKTMFEFGPSDFEDQNGSEIEIYLSKLTAETQTGLMQCSAGFSSNYLPVRFDLSGSIFQYSAGPLVYHQNMPVDFPPSQALYLIAENCFFPHEQDLWAVDFQDASETRHYDVNTMEEWAKLTGVPGNSDQVLWKTADRTAIPSQEATAEDYRLEGEWEQNPAIRKKAGVDPALIPEIPSAL